MSNRRTDEADVIVVGAGPGGSAAAYLANLTDPRGGDAMDRIINGLSKVSPKV